MPESRSTDGVANLVARPHGASTRGGSALAEGWAHVAPLAAVVVLFVVLCCIGITWGTPSRDNDAFLFGDAEPWSGEKIWRLSRAAERFAPDRGADVDVDPLAKGEVSRGPVDLTATDSARADIYLRYRLYSHQPDEMITMMALAGMRPSQLRLDPRLYQYGGLFIYPVGALIKLCGIVHLIDVRSDVAFYLDNPKEFGKFYVVARAYSAAWGVIGVLLVFSIARRLSGVAAGLVAGLLFALMPVVICMAHEGKPHLPGSVLMLAAVWLAMRCVSSDDDPDGTSRHRRRDWHLMCVACGASFGMVLSSWPIFVLIPLTACLQMRRCDQSGRWRGAVVQTVAGAILGVAVYLITNPYIVINLVVNRDVLASNFGNSFAMYEVSRVGAGVMRVLELTTEGATLPVLLLGMAALALALRPKAFLVLVYRAAGLGPRDLTHAGQHSATRTPAHSNESCSEPTAPSGRTIALLAVPAALFFVQFVLIGADKPAEYGRFGIFTNTALAIGAGCVLAGRSRRPLWLGRWVAWTLVIGWVAWGGGTYLWNFHKDTTALHNRVRQAAWLAENPELPVALLAEPAPYACPPLRFDRRQVLLFDTLENLVIYAKTHDVIAVRAVDSPDLCDTQLGLGEGWTDQRMRRSDVDVGVVSPISWANKPFCVGLLASDNTTGQ